jgi:hypothetical protein
MVRPKGYLPTYEHQCGKTRGYGVEDKRNAGESLFFFEKKESKNLWS